MNIKKTIAAPGYLHEILLHDVLNQHHTNALGNVSVVPVHALLPRSVHNESLLLEQAFACIQNAADQCPHFTAMIRNPSFLKQLYDFRKEMAQYNIKLDELPEHDEFQKELKLLIQSFYDLPVSAEHQLQFLNSSQDLSHVQLYPSFQSSLFDQCISNHLIRSGAQFLNKSTLHSKRFGKTALNRRQEIEACAQYIIDHQLDPKDVLIVLCDPDSDQKVLKLVFDRYHLPYGMTFRKETSRIVQLYLSTAAYLREKTLESFVRYLHMSSSHLKDFDSLMTYIDMFVTEIDELHNPFHHVQDCASKHMLLDERELLKLMQLEQKAEQVRLQLLLPESEHPALEAYNICRNHSILQEKEELNVFYRIKEILESHYQVIHDSNYLDLICFEIEALKKTSSDSVLECICVTDLTRPVPSRTQAFVLGCIQSSFPNFKGCTGIFDEDYVSFVKGYPSKTSRQAFHSDQISWIFNCAENIIFSASCNDYEGKGRQFSVEIESRLDEKKSSWSIVQHHNPYHVNFRIQSETAKKLFLRDNHIHGSISSFERWFHCPASYFLSYGLKLRKQELPEFSVALVGTIQHAIMEEITRTYQKNIHECSTEKLISIVDRAFDPVIQLFNKYRSILIVTKNRCTKNMTVILDFLKDMEYYTDFSPAETEKYFKHVLLQDTDYPVQIQGIIDRIDMTHNLLRVLDYKSSHKSLSVSKVQSGLQLQLLTYLYIASLLYQKNAAGCYYVSMKNDDIKAPVSKVDARRFEIFDPDDSLERELWLQTHRLDGMTFERTNMLDFDGNHIKGFKNGLPAKIYAVDDLKGLVQTIYRYLAEQLVKGNIALTPTEDACMFCDHFSICRFHSLKVKTIVPHELTSHFFKEVK